MSTFAPFLARFRATGTSSVRNWPPEPQSGWSDLMAGHAGSTFNDGLYRLHTPESSALANTAVSEAHPHLAGHIERFGYDWLGRQFAIDTQAPTGESVRMIEPGTGEVLAIPRSFADFHNIELIEDPEAALAAAFFDQWADANRTALPLAPDRCAGYRVPLFMGGDDDVENLETSDIWVYWSWCTQLMERVRGRAHGTPVDRVDIG